MTRTRWQTFWLACLVGLLPARSGGEVQPPLDRSGRPNRLHKKMSPHQISDLENRLEMQADPAMLSHLAEWVVTDYLSQSGLKDAILPTEWLDLLRLASRWGHKATKQAFYSIVVDVLARNMAAVHVLKRPQLIEFSKLVSRLNRDGVATRLLAGRWLVPAQQWSLLDDRTQAAVTNAVLGGDQDFRYAERFLWKQYVAGTFAGSYYVVAAALMRRLGKSGSEAKWAHGLFGKFIDGSRITVDELAVLSELLPVIACQLSDGDIRSFLGTLAILDDGPVGIQDTTYRMLAKALIGSQQRRSLLNDALSLPDDNVNLAVAKILAWHCRERNRIGRFIRMLAKEIDRRQLTGDVLAKWRLAEAYAVSLVVKEGSHRRSGGKGRLALAFTAAVSERMRLQCIRELAAVCMSSGEYSYALSMIASLEGQFTKQGRAQLLSIRQKLAGDEIYKRRSLSAKQHKRENYQKWRNVFENSDNSVECVHVADKQDNQQPRP